MSTFPKDCLGAIHRRNPAPRVSHTQQGSVARSRRDGFTLIELSIVLVLLGIVAGIAAPRMSGQIDRTRLDRFLVQFTGDIAYARMLAVRSGESVQLVTAASGTEYSIRRMDQGVLAKQVRLTAEHPAVRITPSLALQFDSRGMLKGTANNLVVMKSRGLSDTLQVLPTGRAYHVY